MKSSIALTVTLACLLTTAAQCGKLEVEDVKLGDCSRKAKSGDELLMHYEGKLTDGSEFDSSYKRGSPFRLTLGAGMVIEGWEKGLEGICKGGIRNLIIPHEMAYGEAGYPPIIPAKATLKFKVELVDFADAAAGGEDGEDDDDDEL